MAVSDATSPATEWVRPLDCLGSTTRSTAPLAGAAPLAARAGMARVGASETTGGAEARARPRGGEISAHTARRTRRKNSHSKATSTNLRTVRSDSGTGRSGRLESQRAGSDRDLVSVGQLALLHRRAVHPGAVGGGEVDEDDGRAVP